MLSKSVILFCAILFLCFTGSEGAELCYDGSAILYCENGCCGTYADRSCCPSVDLPVIVGAVFGALIGLTIIVTIIIVLIKTLCHSKREVQPLPAPQPTVNMTYAGTSGQYPMQQMVPPPPVYKG